MGAIAGVFTAWSIMLLIVGIVMWVTSRSIRMHDEKDDQE
jgi:hypothetical protein